MTAWTTPRTWATSEVVTAALVNIHVRDNELHLYEQRIRSATGITNLKLEAGSYMVAGANLASGAADAKAITFTQAFTGSVYVVATCVNAETYLGDEPEEINVGAYGVSTTGCTIRCRNKLGHEAQNVTISWIAVGAVA